MTDTATTPQHNETPARAALTFDAQEFCHFLADTDWTAEQKIEFIETLWQIVVSFVDLGFDLHPVQQVIDTSSTLELDSGGVLDSPNLQNFETTHAGLDRLVGAGRPDS
ncbi:MAG: hypothetical protein ACOY4O_18605 [Pseudomonadota bacterium]